MYIQFYSTRLNDLSFLELIDRVRKAVSFYGIFSAHDKLEISEQKSNHMRQELVLLKKQIDNQ